MNVTLLVQRTFTDHHDSLRSWRDFARKCFCVGCEAVNGSGEAVRGLVKSLAGSKSGRAAQGPPYSIAEFASGEAANEIPACHIWYGFYLPPTFSTLDESIK